MDSPEKTDDRSRADDESLVRRLDAPALNMYVGWLLFVAIYMLSVKYVWPFVFIEGLMFFDGRRLVNFDLYRHFEAVWRIFFFPALAMFFHSASFSAASHEWSRPESKMLARLPRLPRAGIPLALLGLLFLTVVLATLCTYDLSYSAAEAGDNALRFENHISQMSVLPRTSDIIALTVLAAFMYLFCLIFSTFGWLYPVFFIFVAYLQKHFWRIKPEA